nr:hypothetical protein [uncultured Amphritea sp.]
MNYCWIGDHREPPFDCHFELYLYWNKMTHHSKAHQWLREQIINLCRTLDQPALDTEITANR